MMGLGGRRKNRDEEPDRSRLTAQAATNFTVQPPTVAEKLKARQLDLVVQIKKANEELDLVEKQLDWIKRYPEVEDIIRSLVPGVFR